MSSWTPRFTEVVNSEDFEEFIRQRWQKGILYDDPIDFINGVGLAMAYMNQEKLADNNDEAKYRIGLAIWIRELFDKLEHPA